MRLLGRGWSPSDDQGIFISIIVRNQTHHLKFKIGVEGLRPEITPSDFRPYLLKMGSIHGPSEKAGPDAFSSMKRVDSNRDDMPLLREDDITQNFPRGPAGIATDQEGIGMEHVELQEGHPIVRRFGKGMAFDLEDRI